MNSDIKYWWVSHGKNYESEIKNGYIWSPQFKSNGDNNPFYCLNKTNPGDRIISYAKRNIQAIGTISKKYTAMVGRPQDESYKEDSANIKAWHVLVEWQKIEAIHSDNFVDEIKKFELQKKYFPFDKNGKGLERYLIEISSDCFEYLENKIFGRSNETTLKRNKENIMQDDLQEKINLLKSKHQIILQGPPGTGKTYTAKKIAQSMTENSNGEYKLIQFHPAYSYEDFVRGIVAKTEGKQVSYEVENKTLAEFAQKALENSPEPHILIIDEINRANLPSVLGELIYALEYRGEGVDSVYADKDGERKITLPLNLYIIGTMNTADRSVGHIDYAIRRRFSFVEMLPDENIIKSDKGKELFNKVAKLFDEHLSSEFKKEDVQIGHSYFMAENDDELELKLEYDIKPILREYLKDGVFLEGVKDSIEKLQVS